MLRYSVMELSTKDICALRIIQELDKSKLCVALADLAGRVELPEHYVRIAAKGLIQAGIVESLKGPGGGYALTRPARKITLAQALEAVPPGLAPASPDQTPQISRVLEVFHGLLSACLSHKTVADL